MIEIADKLNEFISQKSQSRTKQNKTTKDFSELSVCRLREGKKANKQEIKTEGKRDKDERQAKHTWGNVTKGT